MPDPSAPIISVVMPVFNRAAVVGRAIDSVLAQSLRDFELIVVDDGSFDGTPDVVAAVSDPRVKLVRMPANAGGNAARNRGIDQSAAPIIAFLDSDDLFLPHKLERSVDIFRERPDVDVLLDSFVKRYRPERDKPDVELRNPVLNDNQAILDALFTRKIWKATPGITARRDAVLRAGKFDEALRRRQDFDFILRLAKVSRLATTDELLWVKTHSADTISANLQNFATSTLDFYRRHPDYYDNPIYRQGFAHDVGRHFARLAKRGNLKTAFKDARPLIAELGLVAFLRLVVEGRSRFRQRRRSIRR